MLKLDTNVAIHTIKMPIDPTYKVISIHKNPVTTEFFIMTGISERDYYKFKHDEEVTLKRGNCEFIVNPDDILCFGRIDFHKGSDDAKELDTFNWLDHLVGKGVPMPANYNYDNHECTSDKPFYKHTETFRNSTLCEYLHGCLGKPEFTLIFRELV